VSTFSEAACVGQFGNNGFYNKDDVEDFYQKLTTLDKVDAVLSLKLLRASPKQNRLSLLLS
jgi:hypothetical protein